jgi:hypothetical protein
MAIVRNCPRCMASAYRALHEKSEALNTNHSVSVLYPTGLESTHALPDKSSVISFALLFQTCGGIGPKMGLISANTQ